MAVPDYKGQTLPVDYFSGESMENTRKSRVCAMVLLALLSGACQQSQKSKEVALDHALNGGVISKGDYDAFKLASAQTVPAHSAETPALPEPAAAVRRGVRQEHIFDPHLNTNAYDVTVPANWKFQGVFVPGSSCAEAPFPVFRMYSPDGLTEIRRMPRFDWTWSDSKFMPPHRPDCLDLKEALSAQDFLKKLMAIMEVAYVRDSPIPAEVREAFQKNIDRMNQAMARGAERTEQMKASMPSLKNLQKGQPPTQKGELAAAIAEYRNGTFMIEEQISVRVMCMHSPINWGPQAGKTSIDSCNAAVRIVRAPKGQLDSLLKLDAAVHPGAAENQNWMMKYMQYQQAVWKARSDKAFADSNARLRRQHDEFERGEAVRARQHQQFLATMQEGTNRSMARAQQSANSRHAIAQDWCDYSLDRQTVTGPGGTVKVSGAYAQTWTDGSGNYYQTNDPNANPNGTLKGNWTQTTQVHGDGTAK